MARRSYRKCSGQPGDEKEIGETMRLPSDSRIIIAVLTLAACALGYRRQVRSTNTSQESWETWEGSESAEGGSSSWRSHRENQLLLRREGGSEGLPVDCCPSTLEMIEPVGGINQVGLYVVLFKDGDSRQRFYELSCRPGVEDRPCRFMDRRLHDQSRCVQKYSFTYAIVKRPAGDERSGSFTGAGKDWMLDYIRVRSGCSCEVTPRSKRKRSKQDRRSKGAD